MATSKPAGTRGADRELSHQTVKLASARVSKSPKAMTGFGSVTTAVAQTASDHPWLSANWQSTWRQLTQCGVPVNRRFTSGRYALEHGVLGCIVQGNDGGQLETGLGKERPILIVAALTPPEVDQHLEIQVQHR